MWVCDKCIKGVIMEVVGVDMSPIVTICDECELSRDRAGSVISGKAYRIHCGGDIIWLCEEHAGDLVNKIVAIRLGA